ncbi:hypothetical protein Tco_0394374 [Tanacetum coccineum]
MHNNIMAAGSKDRPPMLGPGRYSQLQQGESLNVQDVKTNLFWEFGKFTSRDRESMESYYSWFYKLMNESTRNNLQVSPMQVNVQFLQQLQPEWSRIVTARRAKPLALLLAAAQNPKLNHIQKLLSGTKTSKIECTIIQQSSSTQPRNSDPEQLGGYGYEKELGTTLLITNKKLYKPTNNNLQTSSTLQEQTEDTTPRKPKRELTTTSITRKDDDEQTSQNKVFHFS